MLDLSEFEFFIKSLESSLDYLVKLSFSAFWAHLTQLPDIISFLDEFLERFQKSRDI